MVRLIFTLPAQELELDTARSLIQEFTVLVLVPQVLGQSTYMRIAFPALILEWLPEIP